MGAWVARAPSSPRSISPPPRRRTGPTRPPPRCSEATPGVKSPVFAPPAGPPTQYSVKSRLPGWSRPRGTSLSSIPTAATSIAWRPPSCRPTTAQPIPPPAVTLNLQSPTVRPLLTLAILLSMRARWVHAMVWSMREGGVDGWMSPKSHFLTHPLHVGTLTA